MSMDPPTSHNVDKQHHIPTTSEMMASAKTVAEAAKASVDHDESTKVDKAKAADAAANLLDAASHYGKLEDNKTYGSYIEKAEDYLHKYGHDSHSSQQSSTTTTTTGTDSSSVPSEGGGDHENSEDKQSGGYLKMAEGLLKKH